MAESSSLFSSLSQGLLLMSSLVLLTAYLETTCPDEVQKLLKKKGGRELYLQGITMNAFNMLVLGTLCYGYIAEKICKKHPLTKLQEFAGVLGVIIIENFLFYVVHKIFHEIKWLYSKFRLFFV